MEISECEGSYCVCLNVDLIERQAAEIERLRAALEKSADTFADFNRGLRLLNRPLLADACEIAEKAARAALAPEPGEKPA